jgi:CheY-like chemotaxis protein
LDSNQKQLKILSVEDDNIIGEMLVIMLEDMGYEAISVENATEGLEVYNEALQTDQPFELIISDLGMEGMDGITLAKELKKITPDIPIILLTGFSTLVRQGDFEIVNCMLRKPVVIEELKNAIAKIMENRGFSL